MPRAWASRIGRSRNAGGRSGSNGRNRTVPSAAMAAYGWIATHPAPTERIRSNVGPMTSSPQSAPLPCVETVIPRTLPSSRAGGATDSPRTDGAPTTAAVTSVATANRRAAGIPIMVRILRRFRPIRQGIRAGR